MCTFVFAYSYGAHGCYNLVWGYQSSLYVANLRWYPFYRKRIEVQVTFEAVEKGVGPQGKYLPCSITCPLFMFTLSHFFPSCNILPPLSECQAHHHGCASVCEHTCVTQPKNEYSPLSLPGEKRKKQPKTKLN